MEADKSKKIFQSMIVQNKSPISKENITQDFTDNKNFILNSVSQKASSSVRENLNKTEIKVNTKFVNKNVKENDKIMNQNSKGNIERSQVIEKISELLQENPKHSQNKDDHQSNVIKEDTLDNPPSDNYFNEDDKNDFENKLDNQKISNIDYVNFNTEEINSLNNLNLNLKNDVKNIRSKTTKCRDNNLILSLKLRNYSKEENSKSNLSLLNEIFCQNPEDLIANNFSKPPTENIRNENENDIKIIFSENKNPNTNAMQKNLDNFNDFSLFNDFNNCNTNSKHKENLQSINDFHLPLSNSLKFPENQNILMPNTFTNSNDPLHEPRTIFEDINIFNKFEQDKIKKSSIISCDYLLPSNININSENPQQIEEEFKKINNTYNDKKDLTNLQKTIESVKLDTEATRNKNIGPVSTLDYLIELAFKSDHNRKKSIIENLISLEDTIFRWRKIGGDGNCFYRAVIFAYFEKIIFERNLNLLKLNIIEFHNNMKEDNFNKKMKLYGIKTELVMKIFLILYKTLLGGELNSYANINLDTNSNFSEKYSYCIQCTYDFFLRCFNSCKHFDIGLVMLFRYKLYKFIKQNESKLYSKNFSVAIGNLLPEEYETENGNFLFEEFYEDFLLKLFKDAEKIVIYITPFILNLNLNLLAFDFYKNSVEKLKEFSCYENEMQVKTDCLTVLYRSSHYDLIYDEEYFMKNVKFLTMFVNLNEDLKVINFDLLREKEKIKNLTNGKNYDLICFGENVENIEINKENLQKEEKKLILPQKLIDGNNLTLEKINYSKSIDKNEFVDINSFNVLSCASTYTNSTDKKTKNNLHLQVPEKNKNLQKKNLLQSPDISLINKITNNEDLANVRVFANTNNSTTQKLENKNLYTEEKGNYNQNKTILLDEKSSLNTNPISKLNNQQFSINNINPDKFFQNNITCENCKKLFSLPSENSLLHKIKLCEKCLTEEIKSNILSKYLACISHTKQAILQYKDSNEILKIFNLIFFESKLKINNSSYDVHTACKLLGKEFNFVLNEEIKSTICVMCENNLNLNNFWEKSNNANIPNKTIFKFPCNCFCCKPSCIMDYFNLLFINFKKRRNDLICFCGTQYNTNDLKLLFHLCRVNNFSKVVEKICEIFRERIQKSCMLCLQNVKYEKNIQNDRNFYISCEMKDSQIEYLLSVDKFCHIVCSSCFNENYFQNLLMKGNVSPQLQYNKKVPIATGEKLNCMICNDFHEFVSFEIRRCSEGFEERCNSY